MAVSFRVSEGRNQKMTFAGTEDSLSVTWHQDYYVDVIGTQSEIVGTSAYEVLTAPGIPIVNKDIYFAKGKVIPFVICRDKTAEQMAEKIGRWKVSTKWQSSNKSNNDESDNSPQDPPAAITDFTPRVVPILGRKERQIYDDKANEFYVSPTLNEWDEPLIEDVPLLTLQITQYEASITYEQMLARKFRVNSGTYRGQGARKWLVEEVQANAVEVQLAGGATTCAQVTYTVTFDDDRWDIKKPLFDTHYLDASGKKLPFLSTLDSDKGYITEAGLRRNNQFGIPSYITYQKHDDIDFDSFLQV